MKIRLQVKPGLAAFIAFLTFLVYLPALQNELLLWDHNSYVFENPISVHWIWFFSSRPFLTSMLPTGTPSPGYPMPWIILEDGAAYKFAPFPSLPKGFLTMSSNWGIRMDAFRYNP